MKLTVFSLFTIVSVLALVSDGYQLATDQELSTLSEALYRADNSDIHNFVTINYNANANEGPGGEGDPNPLPFLQVDERVYNNPLVSKMRELFDNYTLDGQNEIIIPDKFLDAVMVTPVMSTAMQFLQQKGIVTPDPANQKEMLKTLWFTVYSRGGGNLRSSGFKHVFTVEMKNQKVLGLHNWLFFAKEEKKGTVKYTGWNNQIQISPKKALVEYRLNFNGVRKPVNGMLIGTSPEIELALYTVCFHMREGSNCPVTLNGKRFAIKTYSFTYGGRNLIGSAFPVIA